jgi:hypothetical protein
MSGGNGPDVRKIAKSKKRKSTQSKTPTDNHQENLMFTIIWLTNTRGVDAWKGIIWAKGCNEPSESCYEPNNMECVIVIFFQ